MKPWEELSLRKKAVFVGFVFLYLQAEKFDFLIAETKKTYNVMRENKLRKERMN